MPAAPENVRVAVRVRPFNRREKEMGAASIVVIEGGKTITVSDPSRAAEKLTADSAKRSFAFDNVYGADSLQVDVYNQLAKPIVDQSLRGYNGTIFAYGQVRSHQCFALLSCCSV